MSDLVGNPEDRFSHNEANLKAMKKIMDMRTSCLSQETLLTLENDAFAYIVD